VHGIDRPLLIEAGQRRMLLGEDRSNPYGGDQLEIAKMGHHVQDRPPPLSLRVPEVTLRDPVNGCEQPGGEVVEPFERLRQTDRGIVTND